MQHRCYLSFRKKDRLEETLSGSGTTNRVNGIIVQQAFIGPLIYTSNIQIPRTKKRSIDTPIQELPVYVTGRRPDAPMITPPEIISSECSEMFLVSFIGTLWRYSRQFKYKQLDRIQYACQTK